MTPTAHFAVRSDGQITAVARWYWPEDSSIEVFSLSVPEWKDRNIMMSLTDDPDWERVDAQIVEDWVATVSAPPEPVMPPAETEVPTEPPETPEQSDAG